MHTDQTEAIIAQFTDFSGVIYIRQAGDIFAQGYGFANRADRIPNAANTRFGIASGTKTLTGVAVCQLVDQGLITFDTPLKDCLDIEFPLFDPGITVHHLLSHTAGVPDYFDEETMPDEAFEHLWDERAMYMVRTLRDFLPMFQHEPMKFTPGERFSYSNSGYIILGLIVEQLSKMPYTRYVEQHIFARCGMTDSGFFGLDQLPERTALGYIPNGDGTWRTNIYAIPIIGGSDGGVFVTAPDMTTFWDALFDHQLLTPETTARMLHAHIPAKTHGDDRAYGYGVWMVKPADTVTAYYAIGGDPGVAFISRVVPAHDLLLTVIGNTDDPTWAVYSGLLKTLTNG